MERQTFCVISQLVILKRTSGHFGKRSLTTQEKGAQQIKLHFLSSCSEADK